MTIARNWINYLPNYQYYWWSLQWLWHFDHRPRSMRERGGGWTEPQWWRVFATQLINLINDRFGYVNSMSLINIVSIYRAHNLVIDISNERKKREKKILQPPRKSFEPFNHAIIMKSSNELWTHFICLLIYEHYFDCCSNRLNSFSTISHNAHVTHRKWELENGLNPEHNNKSRFNRHYSLALITQVLSTKLLWNDQKNRRVVEWLTGKLISINIRICEWAKSQAIDQMFFFFVSKVYSWFHFQWIIRWRQLDHSIFYWFFGNFFL